MRGKINIPTEGVLYVNYIMGRVRTYETTDRYRFPENTVLILPEGTDTSDERYETFISEQRLIARVLRNGFFPVDSGGFHHVRADFPLIEGFLPPESRDLLAARLGAVATVIGEDIGAMRKGAA